MKVPFKTFLHSKSKFAYHKSNGFQKETSRKYVNTPKASRYLSSETLMEF